MLDNYTHCVLLIDRSGSMALMKEAAQTAINTFIKDQAGGTGKCTISLYDFDSYHDVHAGGFSSNGIFSIDESLVNSNSWRKVFGPVDASEAPPYTLLPRNATALRDAMYEVIEDTGRFLSQLPEALRPSRVIFSTITDGQENDSRRYSSEALKNSVTRQTDVYKWEFVFMGAGFDAFTAGVDYGITNVIQYQNTGASYAGAYNNFSNTLLAARTANTALKSTWTNTIVDEAGNAEQ